MIKIRNALLNVFATVMAWLFVAMVCIIPITILLGSVKLIMMMFGG